MLTYNFVSSLVGILKYDIFVNRNSLTCVVVVNVVVAPSLFEQYIGVYPDLSLEKASVHLQLRF